MVALEGDVHPAAFLSVKVQLDDAARVTTPLPSTVGPLGVNI